MINNLLHHHPAESQFQKKMDEASQNNCNSGEGTTVPVRVSTNPSSSNETPENPQESESDNKSSDALAIALSSMLTAVIKDFDSKAQDTLQSQDQLASAIDRLTGGRFINLRSLTIIIISIMKNHSSSTLWFGEIVMETY